MGLTPEQRALAAQERRAAAMRGQDAPHPVEQEAAALRAQISDLQRRQEQTTAEGNTTPEPEPLDDQQIIGLAIMGRLLRDDLSAVANTPLRTLAALWLEGADLPGPLRARLEAEADALMRRHHGRSAAMAEAFAQRQRPKPAAA